MKISPENRAYFFQRVAHYQDLLNLRDWRIEPCEKPASKGAMADVRVSLEDRLASVAIAKDWGAMPAHRANPVRNRAARAAARLCHTLPSRLRIPRHGFG